MKIIPKGYFIEIMTAEGDADNSHTETFYGLTREQALFIKELCEWTTTLSDYDRDFVKAAAKEQFKNRTEFQTTDICDLLLSYIGTTDWEYRYSEGCTIFYNHEEVSFPQYEKDFK